jgi:hypothetical protein
MRDSPADQRNAAQTFDNADADERVGGLLFARDVDREMPGGAEQRPRSARSAAGSGTPSQCDGASSILPMLPIVPPPADLARFRALLHVSADGQSVLLTGQTCRTASVTWMPSAVKPFRNERANAMGGVDGSRFRHRDVPHRGAATQTHEGRHP